MKKIILSGGKTAELAAFKGKHVFQAQERISDQSEDDKAPTGGSIIKVLISMLVTIDGVAIVPEQLDEMDGQDVLTLMGEFSAASFR